MRKLKLFYNLAINLRHFTDITVFQHFSVFQYHRLIAQTFHLFQRMGDEQYGNALDRKSVV